jgi:hypothetical protein
MTTTKFHFMRIFSGEKFKGQPGYISTQKMYEIIRTLLYFGISLSLFFIDYFTTKTKTNLLTIVAVLGCLPASKSAVSMILFLRQKGLPNETVEEIAPHVRDLIQAYDMIFTSYRINFNIAHLTIHENCIYAYTQNPKFQEKEFQKHLESILNAEQIKIGTLKVFTDLPKYLMRLDNLKDHQENEHKKDERILEILKNVSL